MPTACVKGESAPTKIAQPPPASSTADPGWPLVPRAIAASAASMPRANSVSAKLIRTPVTAWSKAASYKYGSRNPQSDRPRDDVRELRSQRGAEAVGNPGRHQVHRRVAG